MAVLFDDVLYVVDGTIWVFSGPEAAEAAGLIDEAFAGHLQGLLGAGVPSALLLQAGTQHGPVAVRIELSDGPPSIGDEWDDVVEASFTPEDETLVFENLDAETLLSVQLPTGDYRVRYCGKDVDAGARAGMLDRDADPIESHVMYFWLAPRSGDVIIKLASESGREISRQWVGGEDDGSAASVSDQDSDADDSASYLKAFNSAAHRQQCAAMAALIKHAAQATELSSEPAVTRVLDRLRNGELLPPGQREPLVSELAFRLGEACTMKDVDERALRWRAVQAGEVLRDALRPDMVLCMNREDYGPLEHARNALGSQWDTAFEASLAELRN